MILQYNKIMNKIMINKSKINNQQLKHNIHHQQQKPYINN